MSLPTLLALVALIASIVLVLQHRPLPFPIAALIVSAFEVMTAFGLVHLNPGRVPLGLLLGLVLLVSGVAVFLRSIARSVVAAATSVALVGALQTFTALQHFR